MAELTDPALELEELCQRLAVATQERGDVFLAKTFGVEPWSNEFFQILYSITSRTVALENLLRSTKKNNQVLNNAATHLAALRAAFNRASLTNHWNNGGLNQVSSTHSSPIGILSGLLPPEYSYPKLTEEETSELVTMVRDLLALLREEQLSDRDFVRESLIEGLEQFVFRLERLTWFGWGYSIASLREVILAYITLESGIDVSQNPDAEAVLNGVRSLLNKVFDYATKAKDAAETGAWLVSCSRAALSPAAGFVAGYLTN